MGTWDLEKYLQAWNFAAIAHASQTMPGSEISYLQHLSAVAMEAMTAISGDRHTNIQRPNLLVQCAILHDTIEDTAITFNDLEREFGLAVAQGVQALSKDETLPTKTEQMTDSLARIRRQPTEIWMVKLGDRITNLQKPPHYWQPEKISNYREEAIVILETLGSANDYLAQRLTQKINDYQQYL